VLIIADPSGHRVYDLPAIPDTDGKPIVLQPQGLITYHFKMFWRLGPGSNIPGLATGGASPTTPSEIHIG
jgi:hypothetical protein